jgi:putative ABC transport system permease protein
LILGDGLRLAAIGLLLGAALCYPLRHVLDAFLYQITPADPRIWLLTAGGTLLASLAATWSPARRAGRVDPARILRND